MNNDDATIYNNDKNRNIFLAIRYSTSFIINFKETIKKPWNLRVFTVLKQRLVSLIFIVLQQFGYFTPDVWRKDRKVNLYYEDQTSYVQQFSFSLLCSYTQFRTKHSFNLGSKE